MFQNYSNSVTVVGSKVPVSTCVQKALIKLWQCAENVARFCLHISWV